MDTLYLRELTTSEEDIDFEFQDESTCDAVSPSTDYPLSDSSSSTTDFYDPASYAGKSLSKFI